MSEKAIEELNKENAMLKKNLQNMTNLANNYLGIINSLTAKDNQINALINELQAKTVVKKDE